MKKLFNVILVITLTGCSATAVDKRTDIINELLGAGCDISSYSERFGKTITVKCKG